MSSRVLVLALAALVGADIGAVAPAAAQPEADPTDLAPVQCFVRAVDQTTISNLSAKQLCLGAISTAPADCFAQAEDSPDISDSDALTLCQAATSTAPATCAQRLEDHNQLGNPAIVSYCAQLRWPIVTAPEAGAPECIEATLDRTTLSNDAAVQLCGGSVSAGPVDCYEWGNDHTRLSDDDLVQLCARAAIAAPTYLTP